MSLTDPLARERYEKQMARRALLAVAASNNTNVSSNRSGSAQSAAAAAASAAAALAAAEEEEEQINMFDLSITGLPGVSNGDVAAASVIASSIKFFLSLPLPPLFLTGSNY